MSALSEWESFYVIVGSSAGALTGLQFVVMALVSDLGRRATEDTIGAFATPNIVHFCIVLLLSAVLSAPWPDVVDAAWVLAPVGIGGLIYTSLVVLRARRQEGYKPVMEDWIFHIILPYLSYALLLVGAALLTSNELVALFMFAAMALLLMFVGIHNAWDTATYLVVEKLTSRQHEQQLSPPSDSQLRPAQSQLPPADNSATPSSTTA
jgi:hypothetical protein